MSVFKSWGEELLHPHESTGAHRGQESASLGSHTHVCTLVPTEVRRAHPRAAVKSDVSHRMQGLGTKLGSSPVWTLNR